MQTLCPSALALQGMIVFSESPRSTWGTAKTCLQREGDRERERDVYLYVYIQPCLSLRFHANSWSAIRMRERACGGWKLPALATTLAGINKGVKIPFSGSLRRIFFCSRLYSFINSLEDAFDIKVTYTHCCKSNGRFNDLEQQQRRGARVPI